MENKTVNNQPDEIEEQARIFGALSDPTRLRLLRHLCRECHGEPVCVNYLSSVLGITPSAVSQHLKVLKNVGLVKGERRGYFVHYRINPDSLSCCQRLSAAVLTVTEPDEENCCKQNCPKRRS
jgi:ArsR family transcriptional regulator, arsenate/arsenite/antimonite-responsive transcriptional repressor